MKKFDIITFLVILLIGVISLAPYLNPHYSIDCYYDLVGNQQLYLSSVAGRPFFGLLLIIFNTLRINIIENQQIFWFVSLLIFSIGTLILVKKFIRILNLIDIKKILLLILILCGIVYNIFIVEVFQFNTPLLTQAFSFIFACLAFNLIDENINKSKLTKIILLLITSLFFYQAWIALFVVLSSTLILIRFKEKKKLSIYIFLAYFISITINFLYIVVLHPLLWPDIDNTNRMVGINLIGNLLNILSYQKFLWLHSLNLYPDLIFSAMCLSSMVFMAVFRKYLRLTLNKTVFVYILIIALSIFLGLFLHLFTKDIWLSQRSTVIIGALPFSLLLVVLLLLKDNASRIVKYLTVLVVVFLTAQIYYMNVLGNDLLINNKLEQAEVRNIVKEIENYEKTDNVIVKNIYFINDSNPTQSYKGITQSYDVNVRGLTRSWTLIGIFNFVSDRDFYINEMPKQDRDIAFGNVDRTGFDKTNLIFDRDNVYLLIY